MQSNALQQLETENDDWIYIQDAARLMHVNEKTLREKTPSGHYRYFPELARVQPIRKGKTFLLRSEVLAWKKAITESAIEQARPFQKPETVASYEPIKNDLQRIGAPPGLLRSLGID